MDPAACKLHREVHAGVEGEAAPQGLQLHLPFAEQLAAAAGDDSLRHVGARHRALAERWLKLLQSEVAQLLVAHLQHAPPPLLRQPRVEVL